MEFLGQISSFVEGVKSLFDISGAVKGTLSEAIADGIEGGFKRLQKEMQKVATRVVTLAAALLFVGIGVSKILDQYLAYPGVGYLLTGGVLAIVFLFLQATNK